MLEAARSQIAGTVSEAEVRSLPLNGRNFLDLALLVPGVSPTNVASTQLFPETSAVPGVSLSVGSQRNLSNNFIVDGLSANDDAAGLSGITYGVDAVEQFQVVTSGGQAELGRALGGYINVVTKSGTNVLHGTVYGYFRDDRLNATNALSGHDGCRCARRSTAAASAGRSCANRTFYFANVEQRRLDQTGLATIADANVSVDQRPARGGRLPGAAVVDRRVSESGRLHQRARASWTIRSAARDQLERPLQPLRRQLPSNSRGAGGLNAPSASVGARQHRPDDRARATP